MTVRFGWFGFALLGLVFAVPGCPIAESFEVESGPIDGVELRPELGSPTDAALYDADPHADGATGASPGSGGPSSACPTECTGSCSPRTCHILCDGEQECKESTLRCPSGWECVLACLGYQSCEKAVLECGDARGCSARCAGEQGCKDMALRCGESDCSIECSAALGCENAEVTCNVGTCVAACSPAVEERPHLKGCDQALLCDPC